MNSEGEEFAATLQNVTRKFGSDIVLSGFSHRFSTRTVTGIVGPSGCGKSTLMRIVAGLDTGYQEDGVVSTLGQSANFSFVSGDVVLLSSQNALLPWRTALENVRLPLDLRGHKKRESEGKAESLLIDACLESQAHKYPHQLSDGQRQRLRLAQSLATDPKLLLLDEPFNAIDLGLRVVLIDQVRQYLDTTTEPRSAIIVAHSLEEIVALSNVVLVVEGDPSSEASRSERPPKPMNVVKSINIEVRREERSEESEACVRETLSKIREDILQTLKMVANVPIRV